MKTQNLSIHIIEDDLSFNKLTGLLLKSLGFSNIKSYYSGKTYMESNAYKDKPDIVLVDYHLDNNITGNQLLKAIKTNSKSSEVILMSSFFNESEIVPTDRFKPFAFLSKSDNFTPKLKNTLQRVQKHYEERREQKNLQNGIVLFLIIEASVIAYFISLF